MTIQIFDSNGWGGHRNTEYINGAVRRIDVFVISGENELGLDEGVEEGSSSLEPLSQDECSSDCSGPRSRHSRNRQEPLSLTVSIWSMYE